MIMMKMKMMNSLINVFLFVLLLNACLTSSSFRGIAPQDQAYYSTQFIKCKDGSNKFSRAQLNDDFCDCPDGTDEPGTNACPESRFYCVNAGHSPKLIYSSRVNDGICDCCDGSDEFLNLSAQCPNTCWHAGKAARDKLAAKISTYKNGVSLRNNLIHQAKTALAADNSELAQLKSQEKTLKSIVDRLKEQKEAIEKAEEIERLRKQKEEEAAANKLKPNRTSEEVTNDDKIGTFDQQHNQHVDENPVPDKRLDEPETPIPTEPEPEHEDRHEHEPEDQHEHEPELQTKESSPGVTHTGNDDASESTEELSREELGRLVASRWTGANTPKKTEDVVVNNENHHNDNNHDELDEDVQDPIKDEDDSYASDTDDDRSRYEDDNVDDDVDDDFREDEPVDSPSPYNYETDNESDFSDTTDPSNPSLLEKIQLKFRNILHAVNIFQTPVNQSDAARIRKEFDESSGKLSKIQSRISSLTQKLKHDFGPDKEFYSFYDKCFEGKENKYVYKVCPYKHASQEEGHSSSRLGRWDKFEDSYRVMMFSNGDKCWNGPDRSLTVKLRCGLKNEVTDVDEPSRCEYVALLSTPALCIEGKLKELEEKLEEMNKNQPQKHDEL